MSVNLSALTALELAALIRDASAELALRLSDPIIDRVAHARPVVVLREPPEEDKQFALRIKTVVSRGGYVTAAERQRVAAIAKEFGPWIGRQGLPTDAGTGSWRMLSQASSIPPAQER